jgi:hypothetical protein
VNYPRLSRGETTSKAYFFAFFFVVFFTFFFATFLAAFFFATFGMRSDSSYVLSG